MAHLEISISEPRQSRAATATDPVPERPEPACAGSLDRWAAAVVTADEPCLVVDHEGMIVAASPSACALMGFASPDAARGHSLTTGAVRLLDFTADGQALADTEWGRIPPLLAASSGRLARLLLRLDRDNGEATTVDAVATPLRDGDTVVGSLTFFAVV